MYYVRNMYLAAVVHLIVHKKNMFGKKNFTLSLKKLSKPNPLFIWSLITQFVGCSCNAIFAMFFREVDSCCHVVWYCDAKWVRLQQQQLLCSATGTTWGLDRIISESAATVISVHHVQVFGNSVSSTYLQSHITHLTGVVCLRHFDPFDLFRLLQWHGLGLQNWQLGKRATKS